MPNYPAPRNSETIPAFILPPAIEPLAASLGPANGMDRRGATALLNSVASIDATLAMNGYALNLKFDKNTVAGEKGLNVLTALTKGFFKSGGMEMQLNVIDPEVLADARAHPGKHPGIVVRVAGFYAYFDDLPDSVKQEIIDKVKPPIIPIRKPIGCADAGSASFTLNGPSTTTAHPIALAALQKSGDPLR